MLAVPWTRTCFKAPPLLSSLQHFLAAAQHPLQVELMAALTATVAEHKNEVEEILAADKQVRPICCCWQGAGAAGRGAVRSCLGAC